MDLSGKQTMDSIDLVVLTKQRSLNLHHIFRLQLQCKFRVFRHHPQCNSFCWLRCWQGLILKFGTVGVNSFPSLLTFFSNHYTTCIFSVVHVLVLKVVEVIIAAKNVRLLMVELS